MASHHIVLAVLLAACAFAAAQDTTGQQLSSAPGYTFGSNVEGYLRVSTDACDVKALIDTDSPNWAEAKKIYVDGKNSKKSDGSIRTLRSLATTSYAGEPFYDMYAAYWSKNFNTTDFLDAPISKALDGGSTGEVEEPYVTVPSRIEQAEKGMTINIPFVYMHHELDQAHDKMEAGKTDAATGAPHIVDEVWALYVGEKPECALWGNANRRAQAFGTLADCETSSVNARIRTQFNNMQSAAKSGNRAAFTDAQLETMRLMTIPLVQNIIRYSTFAENDMKSGVDASGHQTEGYASYRTIAPIIYAASSEADQIIFNAMYPGKPVVEGSSTKVLQALESIYPTLGISPDEVGTLGAVQPNLQCPGNGAGAVAPVAAATALLAAAMAALLL